MALTPYEQKDLPNTVFRSPDGKNPQQNPNRRQNLITCFHKFLIFVKLRL